MPVNREWVMRHVHSLISEKETDVSAPVRERIQRIYHPDMPHDLTLENYHKIMKSSRPITDVLMDRAS